MDSATAEERWQALYVLFDSAVRRLRIPIKRTCNTKHDTEEE